MLNVWRARYCCAECGQRFPQRGGLKIHSVRHAREHIARRNKMKKNNNNKPLLGGQTPSAATPTPPHGGELRESGAVINGFTVKTLIEYVNHTTVVTSLPLSPQEGIYIYIYIYIYICDVLRQRCWVETMSR